MTRVFLAVPFTSISSKREFPLFEKFLFHHVKEILVTIYEVQDSKIAIAAARFWHAFIIYHELLQLKHNYNHKNLTFF